MDKKALLIKTSASIIILIFALPLSFLKGQHSHTNTGVESITADELKGHIYFLASDYLAGRVGPSAEYEIAAQYVGAQFAAAGLTPIIDTEDGSKSYFQGVPFAKTSYGEGLSWTISVDGKETELVHKDDFKILFARSLTHKKAPIVYVGFGIEEPDHKWNDFKNLDVTGKIMVVIGGAPLKNGEPILPQEIHKKYIGMGGLQTKIGVLFNKGAAGVIMVDLDGSSGMPYGMIPSQFAEEKYVYQGDVDQGGSRPSLYLAPPEVLNTIMADNKSNPLNDTENVMKNYKPQLLANTSLTSTIEILSEENITTKNIVGIVPGTDAVLKDEYIVVGAHLDHVKPQMGQVCNGADDNASGSSGVIEIAEAIAMNPCKRSVVFIAYTAEEMGLRGSHYFVNSEVIKKDQFKFNLNMDMIGRSSPKNEESRSHYVVSNKKYIDSLEEFITDINDGVTDFPLIFDNDEDSPGGSDHQTFIREDIPAFFFFSGVHADLHQPGDDPEKIDYAKAESITRLGYLITTKLANAETVPGFVKE